MKNVKVWPHLTLVAVLFAAVGMGAAALWMRREPKAQALSAPSAARVERVVGTVGLSRAHAADTPAEEWLEVTPNMPITSGDRLYARDDATAGIAFTGRNFARLDSGSSLDVVSLEDRRTQLALRDGSAIFDIGELREGELFEVATPYGAVDLRQPGLYEVGYNDDGGVFVSVLSGLAEVVGLAGSGQISKGEMLTLLGQTAAQVALSRLSPEYAGGLLDDYYGYQYPDLYDGRYNDYNAYLNDPDYYDPYNRYQSYQYVSSAIPGVYDLDHYGDWQNLNDYGYAWSPRVDEGWAPYQQGYWMMDDPHGLTWVSDEPWGYAPYHYGRWANVDRRWFWVPEAAGAQPAYAPALVAFLPPAQGDLVGWVPLAPGDPYAHAYYDANWQPHYAAGAPAIRQQLVNLDVPGALTAVPVGDFAGDIRPERVAKFDRKALDGARPVLDPLSVAQLRQAALATTNTRRRVEVPPGLAKRLDERQVYTSARPFAPPFAEGRARPARVEAVPDRQKRERLQFRDERQTVAAREPSAARREDRRAARKQRREERAQGRVEGRQDSRPRPMLGPPMPAERAPRVDEGRARGERVGLAREPRREAQQQQQQQPRPQRVRVERPQQQQQQARPQPSARQEPPGQARRQQSAQPSQGGPPKGGGPRGHGGGGGKGKGKP